jgi:hypothetical protein
MTEARCAVCERPLARGDWVYQTRREDKWVHGGCLDVYSACYWRGNAPASPKAGGPSSCLRPPPRLHLVERLNW